MLYVQKLVTPSEVIILAFMLFVVLPVTWNSVAPHLMNLVTTAVFTNSQTIVSISVLSVWWLHLPITHSFQLN